MATLSKQDKDYVTKQFSLFPPEVQIKCDDHIVTLKLERFKMKLVIGIYINGVIKGEWFTKPEKHPESNYLPIKRRAYYTPKVKAQIIKLYGKRQAVKEYPNLNKIHESKFPYFTTPRSALTHLLKVSSKCEVLREVESNAKVA